MEETNKFKGVLSEFKNQKVSDNLISILLKENIYKYDKYVSPYVHLDVKNSKEIGYSFTFKHKCYQINPEVIDEIYIKIFEQIKTYPLNDKAEIEFKLSGYLDKEEKVKFLKTEYSKAITEMSNSPYSRLFLGEKQSAYNNWKDYIISCFIEQRHIIDYLYEGSFFALKLNPYPGRFKISKDLGLRFEYYKYEFWCACYELSIIIDFIEKRIYELEGSGSIDNKQKKILLDNTDKKEKGDVLNIETIFKNDSELLFKFIVKDYKGKLDRAFFSHLYSYFNDELKCLFTGGKDSREYRDYILSNPEYKIESFSKVIPYPDYSPTKGKMKNRFKKSIEKFYSEQNLNKI
jgi:hypothetical protein